MAVCEPTCYEEPIVVYRKGTVFNTYQLLLEVTLQFSFKAISSKSFVVGREMGERSVINYDAMSQDYFPLARAETAQTSKRRVKNGEIKEHAIELMAMDSDLFLVACSQFPDSHLCLQRYSIEQMQFLNDVRVRRHHLHPSNVLVEDEKKQMEGLTINE